MIIVVTCVLAIAVIAFILGVRPNDLPEPEPVSPFAHLDERKAAIYENLRDLQFEYRVGKLSDADYQSTKTGSAKGTGRRAGRSRSPQSPIERHLNGNLKSAKPAPAAPPPAPVAPAPSSGFVCDACGAKFESSLKFCGECGKPMKAVKA